jgi:hypothetical protein
MKRNFVSAGWMVVGVLAICILLVCTKSGSDFSKVLEHSARAAVTSTNPLVEISDLTDVPWDKLFIFSPYTPVAKINSQLGYDWPEAEKTHIDSSDTFYLLVFVKDGKVIRNFKLPRRIGEFQGLDAAGNVFTHDNDRFEVKEVTIAKTTRFIFSPMFGHDRPTLPLPLGN